MKENQTERFGRTRKVYVLEESLCEMPREGAAEKRGTQNNEE